MESLKHRAGHCRTQTFSSLQRITCHDPTILVSMRNPHYNLPSSLWDRCLPPVLLLSVLSQGRWEWLSASPCSKFFVLNFTIRGQSGWTGASFLSLCNFNSALFKKSAEMWLIPVLVPRKGKMGTQKRASGEHLQLWQWQEDMRVQVQAEKARCKNRWGKDDWMHTPVWQRPFTQQVPF